MVTGESAAQVVASWLQSGELLRRSIKTVGAKMDNSPVAVGPEGRWVKAFWSVLYHHTETKEKVEEWKAGFSQQTSCGLASYTGHTGWLCRLMLWIQLWIRAEVVQILFWNVWVIDFCPDFMSILRLLLYYLSTSICHQLPNIITKTLNWTWAFVISHLLINKPLLTFQTSWTAKYHSQN